MQLGWPAQRGGDVGRLWCRAGVLPGLDPTPVRALQRSGLAHPIGQLVPQGGPTIMDAGRGQALPHEVDRMVRQNRDEQVRPNAVALAVVDRAQALRWGHRLPGAPRAGPYVPARAYGSYLECITTNRWSGHGWRTRVRGQCRSLSAWSRSQGKRSRCERRRRLRIHSRCR